MLVSAAFEILLRFKIEQLRISAASVEEVLGIKPTGFRNVGDPIEFERKAKTAVWCLDSPMCQCESEFAD